MPPEPLPFDRKDFFKDRKHERPAEFSSSSSLGSGPPPCRWRETSSSTSSGYYNGGVHGSNGRDFSRWGHHSDFRHRPPGHGKQGGWHMFDEGAHNYTIPRSVEKMVGDDGFRGSMARDGKYRGGRETRGSFSQREWRGHSWDASNGSSHVLSRQNVAIKEQRSGEEANLNGKVSSVNGAVAEPIDGSLEWKPLSKWSRSGSMSSRGSGFSHLNSSKSLGGADSNDGKGESQQVDVAPAQTPGDPVTCVVPVSNNDESCSRKKPRLGWGEGLAKYEKKKVPDATAIKDGAATSGLANSPRIATLSESASPASPSSVACSSSPGVDEKACNKPSNAENEVTYMSASFAMGFQLDALYLHLEKLDDSFAALSSSLPAVFQSDDTTALNKVLELKGEISRKLEVTESEIDALENEMKSLKAEESAVAPASFELPESPQTATSESVDEKNIDAGNVCLFEEDDLIERVLSVNKETARRGADALNVEVSPVDVCELLRKQSQPQDSVIKEYISAKNRFSSFRERVAALKYKAFQQLWKEDMRLYSSRKLRAKSQKKCEMGLKASFAVHQKRSRLASQGGIVCSAPATNVLEYTKKLLAEPVLQPSRDYLKMPALILDERERMNSRFVSRNGLVEDPLAVENERNMINPWTPHERELFIEKLTLFGKDFRKIASFLEHKTTADCVEFYYKNHKSADFEKMKRKKQGKNNADYLVGAGKRWSSSSEVMGDSRTRGSFLRGCTKKLPREDDKETAAADVLVNICGSMSSEAMSSCITTSFDHALRWGSASEISENADDDTCSDEICGELEPSDWTDEERLNFVKAVSSFGKDFAMISQCVKTKSREQCKVFFSKAKKCLGLDQIHHCKTREDSTIEPFRDLKVFGHFLRSNDSPRETESLECSQLHTSDAKKNHEENHTKRSNFTKADQNSSTSSWICKGR